MAAPVVEKTKLALCGVGRIGKVHFIDLLTMPTIELVAIVDPILPAAQTLAGQAGCKAFATFDELLADKSIKIDGVLVCTPTATHTELTKKALNQGIPVFCEKPISLDTKEVDEIYALSQAKGVPLLCGFQRRFDPSFVKLKKTIESGAIGGPQVVQTTSRDHPLPAFEFLKTSGGIFHDCASHDIDVHRWLMGAEPVEVYSTAHAFFPAVKAMDDFDCVVIVFKWPSGAMSTIDLCRNSTYGYDQRIEVLGSKGMVQADNKPRTTMVVSNAEGVHQDCISWSFTDRYPDAYKAEIEHFIELLHDKANWKSKMRVNHVDVRNTGIIANAAEESARTGKAIQLKFD